MYARYLCEADPLVVGRRLLGYVCRFRGGVAQRHRYVHLPPVARMTGERISGMKTIFRAGLLAFVLQACSSPPKPAEPTGQWMPVNQPLTQQAGRTDPK
ncbi:hypothetical protein GCT13_33890 [Paraburkholderia sp. CNPSo 3157]|uniref:Uncharacterized protein n=1 Tax=Paraburkholderia franconis TaxID=2654983 RepID=A0A7X1TJV5_9BURK|nr:hypothetical protein [Paraburkholderia franconis]